MWGQNSNGWGQSDKRGNGPKSPQRKRGASLTRSLAAGPVVCPREQCSAAYASTRASMEEHAFPGTVLPTSFSSSLQELGYCIVERAASASFCAAVRAEVEALAAARVLQPSLNRVATDRSGNGAMVHKAGVSELDVVLGGELVAPSALEASPSLSAWWASGRAGGGCAALRASLNDAAPWLRLTRLDTLKLQFADGTGRGCFPIHYDTQASTGRTLTAILYLSPRWTPDQGGQLRLLPFPFAPVDVAPSEGTLAVFSSVAVAHQVMPSLAPRCVLSLWFTGDAPHFPTSFPTWLGESAAHLAFLRTPANARVLCKVLFAREWAASIELAFGRSGGVDAAVALHFEEVAALKSRLSAPLLALLEDTLPLAHQDG